MAVMATGTTLARSLTAMASDVVNVKNWPGVDSTGTTDSTAGLQAAFAYAAEANLTLYFPAGTYIISSLITQTSTSQITIYGDSLSSTQIVQTGTEGALSLSAPQSTITGITIGTTNSANTGTGLTILNSQPLLQGISVGNTISGSTAFATQIALIGCGETSFSDSYVKGGASYLGTGLVIDGTPSIISYNHKITSVFFYNNNIALSIGSLDSASQTNISYVQGILVTNCIFVANNVGISWLSLASNLNADMLLITNCHINCNNVNIQTNNVWHLTVTGCFLYPIGSGYNMKISNAAASIIDGCHIGGGATTNGIDILSANPSGAPGVVIISNCQFSVGGGPAINIASGVTGTVVIGNYFFDQSVLNNGTNTVLRGNSGTTAVLDSSIGCTSVYATEQVFIAGGGTLILGSPYVAGAITPTGYVEITDSGGVVRKIPCA
jgi:hypothetical protein